MAIDWANAKKMTTEKPAKRPGNGGCYWGLHDFIRCFFNDSWRDQDER
jgi:hypothetical protein